MKFTRGLIFFLIFIPYITFAQQPLSDDVFNQPIIEGSGAAGIKLGDTEVNVVEKMGGLPHVVQGFGKPQKTLTYGNVTEKGGVFIDIFMEKTSVIGVEIISIPTEQGHLYKGKTKKGFQFGDTLEQIKTEYGVPHKFHDGKSKILWYKKEGIIFEYPGFVDPSVGKGSPQIITIIHPNSNVPQHIRKRGGPEGLWE